MSSKDVPDNSDGVSHNETKSEVKKGSIAERFLTAKDEQKRREEERRNSFKKLHATGFNIFQ
jgi:hypothetical protein